MQVVVADSGKKSAVAESARNVERSVELLESEAFTAGALCGDVANVPVLPTVTPVRQPSLKKRWF